MEATEFDLIADDYEMQHRANIAMTGEAPEYFSEYKVKALKVALTERGIDAATILDFGSGIGNSIPYFRQHMPKARLSCADVSARSLAIAGSRFANAAEPLPIEERRIPAADASFDVSFSACVFHHIDHDDHTFWLRELLRVTRPGGLLMLFEHNPLNPLTVRAVNTCPFDVNARLIPARRLAASFHAAGWQDPIIRYHVFFPRILSRLRGMESRLGKVPLGAQYAVTSVNSALGTPA